MACLHYEHSHPLLGTKHKGHKGVIKERGTKEGFQKLKVDQHIYSMHTKNSFHDKSSEGAMVPMSYSMGTTAAHKYTLQVVRLHGSGIV